MPTLTRWFLRSGLVYLVLSLVIGVALAVPHGALLDSLTPVYFHLLMVGWVTQTIFGVAYWMFPRFSPDRPHGSEHLALMTYASLNVGLISRAVAEPMLVLDSSDLWTVVLIISAVLQWLAALAFAVNTWARVKTR